MLYIGSLGYTPSVINFAEDECLFKVVFVFLWWDSFDLMTVDSSPRSVTFRWLLSSILSCVDYFEKYCFETNDCGSFVDFVKSLL